MHLLHHLSPYFIEKKKNALIKLQLLSIYIVNRLTFLILTKTEVGKKKEKSSKRVEDKIDLAALKKGKGKKGDAQCITHVPRFIYEGLLLTFLIYF